VADRVEVVRQLVHPDVADQVVVGHWLVEHGIHVLGAVARHEGQAVPVAAVIGQDGGDLPAQRVAAAVGAPAQQFLVYRIEQVVLVDQGADALGGGARRTRMVDRHSSTTSLPS
jgi:hypothetical protein